MAYGAETLQFADDRLRVLFGMTLPQTVAVVGTWQGVLHLEPHLLGGFGGVAAGGLVLGVCKLTDGVRREPRLAHLGGYLARLALGAPTDKQARHIILEVDGYTRDALTEEEQNTRLANRLQIIIASIGPGGAAQILVVNTSRDHATLVRDLRTAQRPVGRPLAELADRAVERLATREVRETDIRFYLVLYEPKGARRAPWWLRLLRLTPQTRALSRRLFGEATAGQILLTNVAAETRARLRTMGLSARIVAAVAGGDVQPVTAGEMANACRLSDGRYAASFSLLTPPARTNPGWLDPLLALRGPYRLAVWAHGTDANRERTRLQTRNRQTGLQLLGTTAGVGEKSAQFTETEAAMMRLRQPNQAMMRAGVYMTCIGDTAADAITKAQQGVLVMESPAPGVFHQFPLAASTLPGHDRARCCWRMDAETVANMYPFNRTNPSTAVGLHLGATDRGELVRLDPGDESLRNALCVIFGLSGMGKTLLTQKVIKAWRERGGPVTILDRSGHYQWLAATIGGVTVKTAAEMEALPLTETFVIVDLTTNDFNARLRTAVDHHVQSKVHDMQMLFVVEEAWQLEYLDSALWVMDLAKRGRHWGGFVWWVTHDPKELLNHPQLVSMFDQAAVKVAFALVDSEGVASRLGSAMGLTAKEIETVKALAQGECYLMRHNALDGSIVRGKVNVDASEEELWLFESDPRHWQYKRREQEIAACDGDVWRAVKRLVETVPFRPQEKEAVAAAEAVIAAGTAGQGQPL